MVNVIQPYMVYLGLFLALPSFFLLQKCYQCFLFVRFVLFCFVFLVFLFVFLIIGNLQFCVTTSVDSSPVLQLLVWCV